MPEIDGRCILLELQARNKQDALTELVTALCRCLPEEQHHGQEQLVRILLEREQLGSTGVGGGVAIPHGKVAGLRQLAFCFGRSREGIGFDALDNRPVHLLMLILSPLELADEYLQALAVVSRLLKDENKRDFLLQTTDISAVTALFRNDPSA